MIKFTYHKRRIIELYRKKEQGKKEKKDNRPLPTSTPSRDNNEQDIVYRNFFTICLLPISKLHGLYGELRNGGKLVLSELGVVDNCWPMEGFERENGRRAQAKHL